MMQDQAILEKENKQQINPAKDKHILVAIDESENAKRVLMYVADFLGNQRDVRITLLSIIPEPSEDYFSNDWERAEWLTERFSLTGEMLNNYSNILVQSGLSSEKINKRMILNYRTSISECILAEQQNLGCCTIVIGRRVISRKEEFLFGSTSCKILRARKSCAVWIIE